MLKTESHANHPTGKLLFLGVAFGMGLVYASLIPLQYEPLSWNETIERFRDLRWLDLNVYRRADWVANGLAVIPFGFLLAGAADRNHHISFRYLLQLFAIMSCGILVVVGIEFAQLWYPPRTVSGNDIAAGCVGAIIGPLLWPLLGRPYLKQWHRLRHLPKEELLSPKNSQILLFIYSALLIAYSIMPLDIMFSTEEWQIKYQKGRFAWIPGASIKASINFADWLEFISGLVLSSIRMIPFGALAYHSKLRKSAPLLLIGFPILLEVLQAPIFSRLTLFSDVLLAWIGGVTGLWIAAHCEKLHSANQSFPFRLGLTSMAVTLIELSFLGRYERLKTTNEINNSWVEFLNPPFSRYYYTTEFLAASNFAGKAIIFGVLGFTVQNLVNRWPKSLARIESIRYSIGASVILIVAVGTELPQIYLHPFYADASDILIYCMGASVGWMLSKTLAINNTQDQLKSPANHLPRNTINADGN